MDTPTGVALSTADGCRSDDCSSDLRRGSTPRRNCALTASPCCSSDRREPKNGDRAEAKESDSLQ